MRQAAGSRTYLFCHPEDIRPTSLRILVGAKFADDNVLFVLGVVFRCAPFLPLKWL